MTDRPAIIGVLGGMGPEATVDFLRRVVRATPAANDADHIRILVDNNPGVPSRIEYILHHRGRSPAPVLVDMARGLQAAGADFLVMPCNTAHLFADDIRAAVSIPLLDMIDVTRRRIAALTPGVSSVGLLASTAVVRTGIYERAFSAAGMSLVVPDDDWQVSLMSLIKRVKSGTGLDTAPPEMRETIEHLVARGAQACVVACTDLSTVQAETDMLVPVVDASQCLAE